MLRRFILLALPRTGSNLLAMALHAHPAVVMAAELFHPQVQGRKEHALDPKHAFTILEDYYHEDADPVQFLQNQLYGRAYPPEKKVVGFKLFHSHLEQGPAACFWDWLAGERDISIIHLYRRRILEAFVSLEIALMTQEWRRPIAEGPPPEEMGLLTLDVQRFKNYVDRVESYMKRMRATLMDHPTLTLEYQEDLSERFDESIKKVEAFLDIDPLPLPRLLQKQSRRAVADEVANFREFQEALKGTPYETYL